jgi:hypothetical protein
MGIFGWSYPPGCNSVPGDEERQCEVCGGWDIDPKYAKSGVFACICPECPECGEFGNLNCYKPVEEGGHGLILTEAQKAQVKAVLEEQEAIDRDIAAAYDPEQERKDEEELKKFY